MGIRDDRILVDKLCEIDDGLTDWEVDFIEGIARQVHDQKRVLSLKQIKMAQNLLRRKTEDD